MEKKTWEEKVVVRAAEILGTSRDSLELMGLQIYNGEGVDLRSLMTVIANLKMVVKKLETVRDTTM
jgi:hypothetical protein